MNLKWTTNLKTQEEKDNFKKYLSNCSFGFSRLACILQEDLDATITEMSADDSYESPAWAEKQADRLGKIRTLRKVIDLVNIGVK